MPTWNVHLGHVMLLSMLMFSAHCIVPAQCIDTWLLETTRRRGITKFSSTSEPMNIEVEVRGMEEDGG